MRQRWSGTFLVLLCDLCVSVVESNHRDTENTEMNTYIALLRGINVGGHKKVATAELREMLANLGFCDTKTLLQSGNAVFNAKNASEARLETETKSCLGVECDYILRTADELKTAIAANPHRDQAKRDPARLIVVFMKGTPQRDAIDWPGP